MTKRVCAWCGSLLADGSEPISHGICASCADKMHDRLVGQCTDVFSRSRCERAIGHKGRHRADWADCRVEWDQDQPGIMRGFIVNEYSQD